MIYVKTLVLLSLTTGLTSCATVPKIETDQPSVRTIVERGYASWYGKRFQGLPTASGELFDYEKLTAAHRTLPFGTMVEVRSVASGKSVIVKINDRGPSHRPRILDLSQAAAEELGMINKGEDLIEILR